MKFSQSWLVSLLGQPVDQDALLSGLTMAGLEVESCESVAKPFTQVIVGEVRSCESHPNADKLRITQIDVGLENYLQIVCGASNVRAGLKVAVAIEGAVIGDDYRIKPSKLRGVDSFGMCCSASELGLSDTSSGIIELPSDAPIGVSVRDYLALDDSMITLAITPNRGDCLSLTGLARETAAIFSMDYTPQAIQAIPATDKTVISVTVQNTQACPYYVGRVIRNVHLRSKTPRWMQERLTRSGLRVIDPVVDVTNYVMLELGQPLHAFDLRSIRGGIVVRDAKPDETITLLNDNTVTLDPRFLVIADHEQVLAVAGVMGGRASAVSETTQDIFLESAYFEPSAIANRARWLGLQTDAAYRFERGVDPNLARQAIERATEYLLAIVGGEPGPVESVPHHYSSELIKVVVPKARLKRLSGLDLSSDAVRSIWHRLGFLDATESSTDWQVTVPSFRHDIRLAEDLIEEVVRIYGYDRMPTTLPSLPLSAPETSQSRMWLLTQRQRIIERGYREIISYSFVDRQLQVRCDPSSTTTALSVQNPISAEMNVMRTRLMPGLIQAALYNQRRQQTRGKLFEIGTCFRQNELSITEQIPYLAGIAWGEAEPLQWGISSKAIDFFEIKGDVVHILQPIAELITFQRSSDPTYHPGQSAVIHSGEQIVGSLGQLHPTLQLALDITQPLFYFECLLDFLTEQKNPIFSELSKFPSIRRDLALLINKEIPVDRLSATIQKAGGDYLIDVTLFDVYHHEKLGDKKSIALSLVWQDTTKTLMDADVNTAMDRVLSLLYEEHNAILRE